MKRHRPKESVLRSLQEAIKRECNAPESPRKQVRVKALVDVFCDLAADRGSVAVGERILRQFTHARGGDR